MLAALGFRMSIQDEPWVKINSETYLDCIVGNRSGLLALKDVVENAIENKGCDTEGNVKADFKVVVCSEERWNETEAKEIPKWQEWVFQLALLFWVVLLPALGIWKLVGLSSAS